MKHANDEVQSAIIKLNDALCSWERNTGRESILIIREQGGFVHRSVSGKPLDENYQDDVTDEQLMDILV